jgi:hypothetical protein
MVKLGPEPLMMRWLLRGSARGRVRSRQCQPSSLRAPPPAAQISRHGQQGPAQLTLYAVHLRWCAEQQQQQFRGAGGATDRQGWIKCAWHEVFQWGQNASGERTRGVCLLGKATPLG